MELLNSVFSDSLNIILFLWIAFKIFDSKVKKEYVLILGAIEIIVLLLPLEKISSINNANLILFCNTLLLIFVFEGKLSSKIFVVGIYVCIGSILEILSFELLHLILDITYSAIDSGSVYFFIGNVITNLSLFIIFKLISKYMIPLSNKYTPKKMIMLLSLPITSFLFVSNITDFNNVVSKGGIIPLIIIGLLFSNLIIFYVFFDTIKILQENADIKLKDSYDKIDELNYELLESKYRSSQSFLHDIKRHLNIISYLIQTNAYEELDNYSREINQDIEKQYSIISTNQQSLNIIIQQYKDVIIQNNISFKIDVDDSDLSFLSLYEQNVIFSNLLENAVESCLKMNSERNIILRVKTKNRNTVIKIINSCNNAVIKDNLPITTKNNSNNHGFGLKNIDNIIKSKNGHIICNFEKDSNIFESIIIFIGVQEK